MPTARLAGSSGSTLSFSGKNNQSLGVEPFTAVIDSDFKGISPELDEHPKLRTRMRRIVSEEFVALFGENAPKQMGFVRNPAHERITRPIHDLAAFIRVALKSRELKLLPFSKPGTSGSTPDRSNPKTSRPRPPASAGRASEPSCEDFLYSFKPA